MANAKYKLANPRDGAAAWAPFSSPRTDRLPQWGEGPNDQANAKIGAFLVAEAARTSGAFQAIEANIEAYIASVKKGGRKSYEKELLGEVMGSAEDGSDITFARRYPGLSVAKVMAEMARALGADSSEAAVLATRIAELRKSTKIQDSQQKPLAVPANTVRAINELFDRVLVALEAKGASVARRSATPPADASASDSSDLSDSSKSKSGSDSGSDSDSDSDSEKSESESDSEKLDSDSDSEKSSSESSSESESSPAMTKKQKKIAQKKQKKADAKAAAAAAAKQKQKQKTSEDLSDDVLDKGTFVDKESFVEVWIATVGALYQTGKTWLADSFDELYTGELYGPKAPSTLQKSVADIQAFIDVLIDRTQKYVEAGGYEEIGRASRMSVQAFKALIAFLKGAKATKGLEAKSAFYRNVLSKLMAAEYRVHYSIVNAQTFADSGLSEFMSILEWPLDGTIEYDTDDVFGNTLAARKAAAVKAYSED